MKITCARLVVLSLSVGLCAPAAALGQVDAIDPFRPMSADLATSAIPTLPCGFALLDVAGHKVPVIFSCPLEGQPMSGIWVKTTASSDADTTVCRACAFTAGQDIKSSFKTDVASPAAPALVASLPVWDAQGGLRQQYQDVVAATSGLLPSSPVQPLLDRLEAARAVLQPFATLAGTTIKPPQTGLSSTWTRAFAPIHGRHLVHALRPPELIPQSTGWIAHDYPDPQCLAELRWRGARSYCAMRQAALSAGGARLSLGSWSIGDALFWSFGDVAPSLRFVPPVKDLEAASANTFAIPLLLGGNLTPARGPILPNFGDLSHPLLWLTGDAEVFSDEDFGSFFLPPTECFGRGVCQPNPQSGFRRRFRNLKHVDVLAGTSASATLEVPDVLLATFGPASLFLNGTITIDSGLVDDGNHMTGGAVVDPSAPDPWPPAQWPAPRSDVLDVLGVPGPEASDAPLRRVLSGGYLLRPVEGGTPAASWSIVTEAPVGTPAAFGTVVRWRNDDDRSVAVRDRIEEAMSIVGKLGFSLGPVHADVSGSSTFTATSSETLTFREQLSAVDPPLLGASLPPRLRLTQSNAVVVAEPHSEVAYDPLTVKLELSLQIELPFKTFTIHWEQQLLKLEKVPLGEVAAEPAEEHDRLRVGEFSEVSLSAFDGAGEKPAAFSHLPGGATFVSFPDTVAACLADPEQPVEPVDGEPVTSGDPPVKGELCAVGIHALSGPLENLGPVPASICDADAIAAYAAGYVCGTGNEICQARRQCLVDALTFLCAPASSVQTWYSPPHTVVAHVLTDDQHGQIGGIVQACATAFADGEPDPEAAATAFAANFIDFIACNGDGTLLGSPGK